MFALKCRRNYAISAESISISQSNIVLIVTAVISLICSGEPTLLPRTFPSCKGQFGAVCFLREELFLQQAGLQVQATGQGVQFSALLLPAYVTLNAMLWPQLTHLWNGGGLFCPVEIWKSVVPSSLTPPSPKAVSWSAAAWNAGNPRPAHCSCPLGSSRRARLLGCKWRQTCSRSFPKSSRDTQLWTSCSTSSSAVQGAFAGCAKVNQAAENSYWHSTILHWAPHV